LLLSPTQPTPPLGGGGFNNKLGSWFPRQTHHRRAVWLGEPEIFFRPPWFGKKPHLENFHPRAVSLPFINVGRGVNTPPCVGQTTPGRNSPPSFRYCLHPLPGTVGTGKSTQTLGFCRGTNLGFFPSHNRFHVTQQTNPAGKKGRGPKVGLCRILTSTPAPIPDPLRASPPPFLILAPASPLLPLFLYFLAPLSPTPATSPPTLPLYTLFPTPFGFLSQPSLLFPLPLLTLSLLPLPPVWPLSFPTLPPAFSSSHFLEQTHPLFFFLPPPPLFLWPLPYFPQPPSLLPFLSLHPTSAYPLTTHPLHTNLP